MAVNQTILPRFSLAAKGIPFGCCLLLSSLGNLIHTHNYEGGRFIVKKKLALAAIGLGATYLMRNRNSRDKLSKQFEDFANTPLRGDKDDEQKRPTQHVSQK